MRTQDWLLFVIALLLGVLIVQLGAFGALPPPTFNAKIIGQDAELRVMDVAAVDRARGARLEESVRREFAPQRSSAAASLPNYLVREVDGPPSSKVIDEELQIMSGFGYSLVAVLPIVGPKSSSELAWGSDRNRDQPVEAKTVRVILIGKRNRH